MDLLQGIAWLDRFCSSTRYKQYFSNIFPR